MFVDSLSFELPHKTCFKDFSATVYADDRIALIGDNGSGKTTLLKQILTHCSATPIGWMPQDFNEPEHLTVRAILNNAEQAAQDLLERLETEANYEEILEAIEQIDAFNWEVRVEKVLEEMRLTPLANRLYGQLSGGERMRLKLAKMLLRRPEVLLLDEPTNHLDQEMRSWFASFLNQWKGAAILVTHDLDLLMQWPNQIWCLEKGAVNLFSGTYSD
ncbi:MAG: ABC-F family ATP-binding cassette domain-containing protein [Chlamydiia bacterium]|nr:ABC-F family ATP-binding cassette domain-containing protein [Chlamydiia bacterium]